MAPAPSFRTTASVCEVAHQSGGSETLVVKGFDIGKFFEGDQMRTIAEKMLAFQRNGGQVVLA